MAGELNEEQERDWRAMVRGQHTERACDGSLERHEMSSVRPAEEGHLKTAVGLDFILRVMGIIGKLFGGKSRRGVARLPPPMGSSTMTGFSSLAQRCIPEPRGVPGREAALGR